MGSLALLAAALIATSSSVLPVSSTPDFSASIEQAMRQTGARGIAIASIEEGRIVKVEAFGSRNDRGDPLTTDTVMYAASVTKAVVGYLTVQLAAEKKLDLDRPIASLLPLPLPEYGNIPAYGHWGDLADDPRWKLITPRMVLDHSTGFANFAFVEPDKKLHIHFDPGSRYAYSGEGMMLLQFGMERGLGLNLEAALETRFFNPLGMKRTSLIWRPEFKDNLADGWDLQGRPQPHVENSRVRAAGSMDTTPDDLATMAAAMVRGFGLSHAARRDFSRGTLPITTKQQFPTLLPDAPTGERPAAAAALGVIAFNGPQGPGWYKGGHDDTTANTLVCLERRRRCVLIMANDVRAESAFPALVRNVLGETGVPYRWEYPGLSSY